MWIKFSNNPCNKSTGDCTVRALSKAFDTDWYEAYDLLYLKGRRMCDMPSNNAVWGAVLKDYGFKRHVVPTDCSECYTIRDFCLDNPRGEIILATGDHVVAVQDGNYYDSWDSGNEIPIFYFQR